MSLPVVTLTTARTCGHCKNMRGQGIRGKNRNGQSVLFTTAESANLRPSLQGGFKYDVAMARMVLMGGQTDGARRTRFLMFHMETHSSRLDNAPVSISELTPEGTSIRQVVYKMDKASPANARTTLIKTYVLNDTRTTLPVTKSSQPWADTVQKLLPMGFRQYLFYYPCVCVFPGKAWDAAVQNAQAPLYGKANGLPTSPQPPYGVSGENIRGIDLDKFISDNLTLEAPVAGTVPLPTAGAAAPPAPVATIHIPTPSACAQSYRITPLYMPR